MNTEPRRIKKIVRKLTAEDLEEAHRRADGVKRTSLGATTPRTRAEHAYALVKPRSVEGFVTLTQLASERGIQAQLARIWVKNAGIKKPGERWQWKEGSRELKNVRRALELKP